MDKPQYHGQIDTIRPTVTECLEVDIEDNPEKGGTPSVIRLSVVQDGDDGMDLQATMDVCPADARSLAWHLLNAADVVDQAATEIRAGTNGVRQLSTITLCGTRFFIDERLRQLRNVENPAHSFDLVPSSDW